MDWVPLAAVLTSLLAVIMTGAVAKENFKQADRNWLRNARQVAYSEYYAQNRSLFNSYVAVQVMMEKSIPYEEEYARFAEAHTEHSVAEAKTLMMCQDDLRYELNLARYRWRHAFKHLANLPKAKDFLERTGVKIEIGVWLDAVEESNTTVYDAMRREIEVDYPKQSRFKAIADILFTRRGATTDEG